MGWPMLLFCRRFQKKHRDRSEKIPLWYWIALVGPMLGVITQLMYLYRQQLHHFIDTY